MSDLHEKIVQEYLGPLFYYALRKTSNKYDAEDLIQEIPDLIVAIKGNCLSVCIYEESLKGPGDDVPIPVKKRPWLSPEHDKPLVTMLKLLLIGLIGGVTFGAIMFILSEYYW